MADKHTTHRHRRDLAPPLESLTKPVVMDPSKRKHLKPSSTFASSAASASPKTSSSVVYKVRNHLSNLSLTSSHNASSRAQNPDVTDINLQRRALTKSAIFYDYYSRTAPHFSKSKSLKEGQVSEDAAVKRGSRVSSEVEKDKRAITVVKGGVKAKKEELIEDGELMDVKERARKEYSKLTAGGGGRLIEKPAVKSEVASGGAAAATGLRRRSSSDCQVELGDFLVKNGVKVIAVDMAPYMQIHAVGLARKTADSLEKFTSKALAHTLKKEFDGVYGPAWHCIVGTSFGSFVTHSVGGFMYFNMDHKHYVLMFKTTVQKAK